MFLREKTGLTARDLRERIDTSDVEHITVDDPRDVEFRVGEGRIGTVTLGDREVEVTKAGLTVFGSWLDVPKSFLLRVDADIREHLLNTLVRRSGQPLAVSVREEEGVVDVRDPNADIINPARLVETAIEVIDESAEVVSYTSDVEQVQFEVVAPEGFDRGIGGDPQVDDITQGGLRFGHDRKHNLAPWVQPYFFRLACTNGYETYDEGLKVDARGSTINEVMRDLEDAAQRAFGRIESEIASFYEMRSERLDSPEQTIIRLGRERGLPDRTVMSLVERVPEVQGDDGVSMFDAINLITNQANAPGAADRLAVRRRLEQAGGTVITEHAARCPSCQSRLDN